MELEDTEGLGEDSVRICGAQFEGVTGAKALENRLKPWRGRVVSVSTKDGKILRLLKGNGSLPIPAGKCWLGPRTRSQLVVEPDTEVQIEAMPIQWLARIQYYDGRLKDSVRFAFRIGFWGLIFAVFSIALSIASLGVSILSLVWTS
jgi:hypothetical protein